MYAQLSYAELAFALKPVGRKLRATVNRVTAHVCLPLACYFNFK